MRLLIFELLKLRFNKNFSITKIFFYLQIKFFYIWFIYIYIQCHAQQEDPKF